MDTQRENRLVHYALAFLHANIDGDTAEDLGTDPDTLEQELSGLLPLYEYVGWKAAVNGAGNRPWFVMHHEDKRYYRDKQDNLVRYASHEGAQRKADELNRLRR